MIGCVTTGDDLCKFPFDYGGKTYYHCTEDFGFKGSPWCLLADDSDEYNEDSSKEPPYGICSYGKSCWVYP